MRAHPAKGGHNPKKGVLGTDLVKGEGLINLHKRGFLGAYLLIIFTFTCQHDEPVAACSDRIKGGGGS